jgi:two-component system, chemotaxis family, protein-glutamate methylesterase/glutaminase
MQTIRAGGGLTIAESEASCVVYGMPRAAWERGGATCLLPLAEIAGFLGRLTAAFPAASAAPR